jgi:hypothetical protein
MRTQTRLLVIASLCGAIVGALAAWRISSRQRTNPTRDSYRHLATIETAHTLPIHSAPPPLGSIPLSPPMIDRRPSGTVASIDDIAERAFSLVAWGAADDPSKSERLCTVGEPIACLALAEREDQHQGIRGGYAKSRAYKERAYSLLVPQCRRRAPEACVAIARMHALGFGLPKDPTNQAALIERAREICKRRPATVCSAFDP